MRILRISPSYSSHETPGSGLNAYSHTIHSRFQSYVLTESNDKRLYDSPNAVVTKINVPKFKLMHNSMFYYLSFLFKSIQILLFLCKSMPILFKYKFKIVHCYTPIHILTGMFSKLFFKSKLFVSLHGTDLVTLKRLGVHNLLFYITDCVLLTSNSMYDEFPQKYHHKIKFMGNGFDDSLFFNRRLPRKKQIITVGGLRWQKNQELLIRAFSHSKLHVDCFKLVIVGTGKLKNKLFNLVTSLGIAENVNFIERLNQYELSMIYNESYIFALSSVSEGSPKVVIEAMASGLPVISTDVGDISNIVGSSGIICNSDIEIFSQALITATRKKWSEEQISERILHRTWSSITDNLDNIYLEF